MKASIHNPKLKLNKEVVTKFNAIHYHQKPVAAVDRMMIFTCCDGRSYDTNPYRKW